MTRIHLGHVVLPDSHPRAGGQTGQTCPIFSFVIEHRDGLIVIDTGPRMGHPVIDELYVPSVRSIIDALNSAGFDERDVTAVVNTHLHFDHCGQNQLLDNAPVWTTAAEIEAAAAEFYTVPEWAAISNDRLRLADDEEEIAADVRILHTPGHTPGHLSVVVDTGVGPEIVAGQACYLCAEFDAGVVLAADMHDDTWSEAGQDSLRRLRDLDPVRAHFSHDDAVYCRL